MPKCSYCGKMYESPRGLTLVSNDGTVKYLCSAKCRKNMTMKRRKVRWISKKKKSKEALVSVKKPEKEVSEKKSEEKE